MLELKKLVFTLIRVKNSFEVMTEFVELPSQRASLMQEAVQLVIPLYLTNEVLTEPVSELTS